MIYGKCPLENAGNGISEPLNLKISWGSMPPEPPSASRLRRSHKIIFVRTSRKMLATPLPGLCCATCFILPACFGIFLGGLETSNSLFSCQDGGSQDFRIFSTRFSSDISEITKRNFAVWFLPLSLSSMLCPNGRKSPKFRATRTERSQQILEVFVAQGTLFVSSAIVHSVLALAGIASLAAKASFCCPLY